MTTHIPARVVSGDLLKRGSILIGPAGLAPTSGQRTPVRWLEIRRIGAEESKHSVRLLRGMTGAGIAAVAAATLTGPVGVGVAALAGAALLGSKAEEHFEFWSIDGRMAEVKAAAGTMKQCRLWHEFALAVLRAEGLVAPISNSAPRGLVQRLLGRGESKEG